MFGLFLTPVFYVVIGRIVDVFSRRKAELSQPLPAPVPAEGQ